MHVGIAESERDDLPVKLKNFGWISTRNNLPVSVMSGDRTEEA